MKRIWLNGGVSSARLNIMERTKVSKTFILIDNKAVAFVAIHNDIAMFHALEVLKEYRREGLAKKIMQQTELNSFLLFLLKATFQLEIFISV